MKPRSRHLDQPALNMAVAGAIKREVGDAFVFDRRATVDISPLVAVALAAAAVAAPVAPVSAPAATTAVEVAAPSEDGPFNEIAVNAVTGKVATHNTEPAPAGEMVGEGRRHRIAVSGTCENGHHFSIVFTQHKGQTFVEVCQK